MDKEKILKAKEKNYSKNSKINQKQWKPSVNHCLPLSKIIIIFNINFYYFHSSKIFFNHLVIPLVDSGLNAALSEYFRALFCV